MNFGERFKSHAKTLAEAAKQFQSFDDMAAQDEYIHSDSLNVKNKTNTPASSVTPTRRTTELLDSLISPISMPAPQESAHVEPHLRSSGGTRANSYDSSSAGRNDQQERHEEEESDHDPVLDTIQPKPSLKKKSSDIMPPPSEERKNTNRFMDDLNDRLAKPNVDVEQGLAQTATADTSANAIENDNRWGWRIGAATSQMKELMGRSHSSTDYVPFRSPLSRTTNSISEPSLKDEDYNVVESSAILGADDQAELDRIRLATQSDPVTLLLNIVKQHPQFAFILFTLVLGSAMYFYSRHQGAEDDVN